MDDGTPTASGDIAATTSSSASASPAATPESTTTAAPATEATPTSTITDGTHGEPPKERWADILENTRKKEREAALAEWRQTYGWAESVDRSQLEQMAEWYSRYTGDAGEFVENILQESLQHPVHSASVRSRLGRMLASLKAQQQQAQPERIEPGIPVMNERGEIVAKTYTDSQLEQLLQQKLDAALSPFREDLDARKTAEQKRQEKAHLEAQADADIRDVKSMPFFEEYKADVLAAFNANPKITLRQAYDEVLKTKILPSFTQKAEAKVQSDYQQKANAATVNPGTPAGAALPKFKNFREAAEYFEKHPEQRAAMANQ